MKLLLNVIGAAILAIACGVVMVQISLLLGILFLAGGILCGFILNDEFTEEVMKWIAIATFAMMIPLAPFGSAKVGEYGKWQFETSNAAIPRPKKKEEVDKRTQHEKNVELALEQIAENTGHILDDMTDDRQKAEERYYSLKGKKDAEKDFENGDTSKMKQIPKAEQILPQIVIPEDLPGEDQRIVIPKKSEPQKPAEPVEPEDWQPIPKKGGLIPNTSPKKTLPDLLVQTHKQEIRSEEPATHILGTCGRAHLIIGWTADGRPEYGPCRDIAGQPACSFVRFGTMNWK